MIPRLTILIITASLVAMACPTQSHAANLPAALYPAGTHVIYQPAITNQQMDCMWGFLCEGGYVPNFHFAIQGALHRLSGRGWFADWHHNAIAFELFASSYDATPDQNGTLWSARAYGDLLDAIRAQGYTTLPHAPRLLSKTGDGESSVELQRAGNATLIVIACWTGSVEIEGIVAYTRTSRLSRHMALTYLTRQVRVALHPSSP